MIRKLKSGKYRLYSRKKNPKTGKRRNLGTFDTREAAEKHERAVQYFKRKYRWILATTSLWAYSIWRGLSRAEHWRFTNEVTPHRRTHETPEPFTGRSPHSHVYSFFSLRPTRSICRTNSRAALDKSLLPPDVLLRELPWPRMCRQLRRSARSSW